MLLYLFQQGTSSGSILVYVVLIPALLVIVCSVLISIRVSEGDETELFADEAFLSGGTCLCTCGVKVVVDTILQQGVVSSDNLYQTAFASSIVATDGYLNLRSAANGNSQILTTIPSGTQVDGVACNAVGYFDYWVHLKLKTEN